MMVRLQLLIDRPHLIRVYRKVYPTRSTYEKLEQLVDKYELNRDWGIDSHEDYLDSMERIQIEVIND